MQVAAIDSTRSRQFRFRYRNGIETSGRCFHECGRGCFSGDYLSTVYELESDYIDYRTDPAEQVFVTAPLLVIEIAPEDRWSKVIQKLKDFAAMGCPNIWVFDPVWSRAYRYNALVLSEVQQDTIDTADGSVVIHLSEIW